MADTNNSLVVLWSSGDREIALSMAFMYAHNAKLYNWWETVTLIVWGPSSKLLSIDEELQQHIKKMQDDGVYVEACRACADLYGTAEFLKGLGIKVRYMGEPFTQYLKEGRKVITV